MEKSNESIDWESELNKAPHFRKAFKKNSIVGVTNYAGEIQYVNENFCKVSKYSREELIGRKHDVIKSGFHDEKYMQEFWKTITQEEIWKGQFQNKAKNGDIYWIESTVYPHIVNNSSEHHYIAIATDITEKVEKESRLKKLLEESNSILNHIEFSVFSINRNWVYTFLNDAAMRNHEGSKEDILGKVLWEVHPDLRGTIFWDTYTQAMESRKYIETEGFYEPMERWFHLKVYPTSDGLSIFYSDISKQKKEEEQRDLYESIINSTHDAIVSLDLEGQITSWNKGAERIFEYRAEEVIGKESIVLVPRNLELDFHKKVSKIKKGERIENYETTRVTGSGTLVHVSVSVSPIVDLRGKIIGASAIYRDISNMKKTQKELANSNRLYAFLSGINQSIVHIKSEKELVENACQVALDVGGYKLAWIGLLNAEGKLVLDNYFGSKEILEFIKSIPDLDKSLRGPRITPTGTALSTGEHAIIQDLLNDENMEVFHDIFQKNGLNSVIVYPLKKFGEVIGVFGLYSSEINHFVQNEIDLLTEASEDISFALELLEKENQQLETQKQIAKSESNLNHAQAMAHIGSFEIDFDKKLETWSDELFRILGYLPNEVVPSPELFFSHVHPFDREETYTNFQDSLKHFTEKQDNFRIVSKDGSLKYVTSYSKFQLDEKNQPIRMYGVTQDVTSQIMAERELEETLAELEDRVQRRTSELEDKNRNITDSINYAKRIQLGLLTAPSTLKEVFEKSFMLSRPSNIVSGDFFWCLETAKSKFIAVADCTGHGVPGALMSIIGNNLLNQVIVEEGIENPADILYRLDQKLATALGGDTRQMVRDGMDIAICRLDTQDQLMHFSGALRPVFLVTNDGKILEITGNRNSIGGGVELAKKLFETKTHTYEPNQRFYLCSDGYYSQFGGEKGKKFMKKRFKELLGELKSIPITEQKIYFLDKLKAWQGSHDQVDDVLLIGIEIK
ncbi:MAG: PAS domain S-box protein [Crocinitomicaceae bacterium]